MRKEITVALFVLMVITATFMLYMAKENNLALKVNNKLTRTYHTLADQGQSSDQSKGQGYVQGRGHTADVVLNRNTSYGMNNTFKRQKHLTYASEMKVITLKDYEVLKYQYSDAILAIDVVPHVILYNSTNVRNRTNANNYERFANVSNLAKEALLLEKFTAIIPTYQRLKSLIPLIIDFNNTAHLDKLIVLWNDENDPPEDLDWPMLDVPLEVISMKRNSLNNKFLPFDLIHTEAILVIDDDLVVQKQHVIAAFKIWQIHRDNLVGFTSRRVVYGIREKKFLYSGTGRWYRGYPITLTGCCFFSKFYSYLYSYEMPSEIREKIDELMNCEDIAMAFLVAHTIKKPPIVLPNLIQINRKRRLWRSRFGATGLSYSTDHYAERCSCINYFVKVYGYMPLIPET